MLGQKVYNISMSHCLLGYSDYREPKNIWKKRSAPERIDPGPKHVFRSDFLFFWRQESPLLTTKQLLEHVLMPLLVLTTRESVPFALSIALPHICENVFGVHLTQC
jgi:hypothetical protein